LRVVLLLNLGKEVNTVNIAPIVVLGERVGSKHLEFLNDMGRSFTDRCFVA